MTEDFKKYLKQDESQDKIVIMKDKMIKVLRGHIASNYRSLTCLPLVLKLLTGGLTDEIYNYLEKESVVTRVTEGE